MLHVFFGTDQSKVRTSALAALPLGEIVRIESGSFISGHILSCAEGRSLFGGTAQYLIDTPSENQSFWEEVLENVESLANSEHTFVVLDKTILAADKKIFTKFAKSITEYKKESVSEFNQFALTDALALRDKRKLWLLLQESWKVGSATEEIIGILWWQLKTMRLAAQTKSAEEAGMKDFPYRKAKGALEKFPLSLVEAKARSLTKLYHDARWGRGDLNQQLEMWVLSL